MDISSRVKRRKEPEILKYYPIVREARQKGKKIYQLNIGQPDIETPGEYFQGIRSFHENGSCVIYQEDKRRSL
ncbi:MAG: hypothetical protein ACOWWR_11065 [Eubacteriales bacterium]